MVNFKADVKFKPEIDFETDTLPEVPWDVREPGEVSKPKGISFQPDVPIPWGVVEPGEVATTPPPKRMFEKELGKVADVAGKPVKKVVRTSLGAISWPFERASALVGTPMREIEKEQKLIKEEMRRTGKPPPDVFKRELKAAGRAFTKGLVPPLKSLVSKKLHPEAVTIPEVVAEDLMPDSPRWAQIVTGLAADFAISPMIVGGVLKSVVKGVKLTGIPQKVKASSLPEWQRMKLRARAKTGMRIEKAGEVSKPLSGKTIKKIAKELSNKSGKNITSDAVKLRLTQIVKGSPTQQPSLQRIANPVIEEFTKTSQELKKLGILGEKTYLTKLTKKEMAKLLKQKASLNKQLTRLKTAPHYVGTKEISKAFPGRAKKIRELQNKIDDITKQVQGSYRHTGEEYFPRMYASKEAERAEKVFPVYSKERIRAPYAKQRKDIPFEVRKQMGEIVGHPAPVVRKRLIQSGADIETAKLFQQAASKPEWASKTWMPGLKKTAIPDTKGYGALKGMYVKPRIYNDVKELVRIKSNFENMYDTMIGSWKTFKVVYSPSTQFRNKISNKILLDLSGMGYAEQAKYATRVLKEWKKNTREYQVAKKYFARTTMMEGELFDDILRTTSKAKGGGVSKMINSLRGGAKKATKVPSKIYQHEEVVGKMMKYFQQRDMGKSVVQAVEEANKWLFDYGDLTRWEKLVARRVMPFYTFPRKALPRVAEAMATRPHTVAKYPLMAKMMTQYSLHKLDMTTKDYEDLRGILPEYMESGSYILMPYRDDNGDLRFFDWTYILPWGEIAEVQNRGILESVVTNPLVQMVGDIQRNKKAFDGRPIWDETDTPNEQNWKKTEYIWRNLVPSLMYKGIYWDKLAEAATQKPSKYGKKRPIPETLAHTITGLRTQPIDVKRQKMYKMFEKQDAVKGLSKKMADITQRRSSGNISEEEFKKKRDQYIKQMKELFK